MNFSPAKIDPKWKVKFYVPEAIYATISSQETKTRVGLESKLLIKMLQKAGKSNRNQTKEML